jgi:hypothetical protein
MNLTAPEIILAVAAWVTLTWLAARAWDATRAWLDTRRRELPPPATMTLDRVACRICHGRLIGSERAYGTCGHCGGRHTRSST